MEREVIVVGSGPAGSVAALELARQGHDVLLLDKYAFPRDKVCGDGLLMQVVELLDDIGVGDSIRQAGFYPIHGSRLVSARGVVLNSEYPDGGFTAPRIRFDALLHDQAVAAGAEFRQARVRAPLLCDGRVTGVRAWMAGAWHDIPARVVIGADGAASALARVLRGRRHDPAHRMVALRAYIEDLELLPHRSEFYLNQPPNFGYNWIFPLGGECANIGVGLHLDKLWRHRVSLRRELERFLARPHIRERLKRGGQLRDIAVGLGDMASQQGVRRAFDGALLAGDAGALVDPYDGGGIPNAVLSALLAAAVVHRALERGDVGEGFLRHYETALEAVVLRRMRSRYRIRQTMRALPILVDFVMAMGRIDDRLLRRSFEAAFNVRPLLRGALRRVAEL